MVIREFKVKYPDGSFSYYTSTSRNTLKNILQALGLYYITIEEKDWKASRN